MTPFLTDFETYPEGYEGARYALFVVCQGWLCVCDDLQKAGTGTLEMRIVPGVSRSAFEKWADCILGRIEDVIRETPDEKETRPFFVTTMETWHGAAVPHLAVEFEEGNFISLGIQLPNFSAPSRSVADVVRYLKRFNP